MKQPKKDEPTFDKQLDTYSLGEGEAEDPIFSHKYQKYLSNLLTARDKSIASELIEEFEKKVAEHYEPIMTALEKIDNRTKEWKLILIIICAFILTLVTVWMLHRYVWEQPIRPVTELIIWSKYLIGSVVHALI